MGIFNALKALNLLTGQTEFLGCVKRHGWLALPSTRLTVKIV
jgi:hypothetical protein